MISGEKWMLIRRSLRSASFISTVVSQPCGSSSSECVVCARRSPTGASPQLRLERSRREGQGDYSTNAAMLLAPVLGAAPREIAERIGDELAAALGENLERVEVAGPGFLNLFLSDGWHQNALAEILAAGDRFGAGGAETPERILIEFVSANPHGPT